MSNSINDFLLGGGGASAKFDQVGDSITGTVVSAEVKQQTDIGTGQPLTWDDGSPRMQLVVRLQTSERNDEDDDGIRNVYVKGSKKAGSKSLHDAVAGAIRAAGAKSLEVGGTLTVTHDGTEPAKTRGFSDRKLYSATYAPPNKVEQAAEFLGTAGQPAQVVPQPQAPQVAAPAQQPTPEQVAAYQAYMASQQQGANA